MKITLPNPILILITFMVIFMVVVGYLQLPKFFINPSPVVNNTGAHLPIQTGSQNTGATNTGIFTQNDYLTTLNGIINTVDRIRYILSFGKNGIDYMSQDTTIQNLLLGNTKASNNILLHSFLQKYQYPFSLTQSGYLVIVTQKPIPANRDLLLAVNGKSIGSINKTIDGSNFISDLVKDPKGSLYIFPINKIKVVQLERVTIDLTKYGNPVTISLAVGENGNSVISIAIINP